MTKQRPRRKPRSGWSRPSTRATWAPIKRYMLWWKNVHHGSKCGKDGAQAIEDGEEEEDEEDVDEWIVSILFEGGALLMVGLVSVETSVCFLDGFELARNFIWSVSLVSVYVQHSLFGFKLWKKYQHRIGAIGGTTLHPTAHMYGTLQRGNNWRVLDTNLWGAGEDAIR